MRTLDPSLLAGRRVACVESCTAGRVAAALAAGDGAASWFRGGLVAYAEGVKREVLGVRAASVYAPEAAREMAVAGARMLGASVAVATTGVAGPDPVEGVPPGTVVIATLVDGDARAATHRFPGGPEEVIAAATRTAVSALAERLTA